MMTLTHAVPLLTLLGVAAGLLLLLRIERLLAHHERAAQAKTERQRRQVRYAYAASLLGWRPSPRADPVPPPVIDGSDTLTWPRR